MDGSRAAVLVEGSVSAPDAVLEALRGWERVVGTVAVEQARAVRALAAGTALSVARGGGGCPHQRRHPHHRRAEGTTG